MPSHEDIPTGLADLLATVKDLKPEDIHIHTLTKEQRDANPLLPLGWVDYAHTEGFAEGMKKIAALQRACLYVLKDYQNMAQALSRLVQVAAAQQAEIEELRADLETVRKERVSVVAQHLAAEVVDQLTDKGTAADSIEVQITHREQELKSTNKEGVSERSSQRRVDVRGKIGGLAKILASMDAKVDVSEADVQRELQTAQELSSQKLQVDLTFSVKGVKPSENPEAHARATLLRRAAKGGSPELGTVAAPRLDETKPVVDVGTPEAAPVPAKKPD